MPISAINIIDGGTISDGTFASTARVEEAMRKDYQKLPQQDQARMPGLLQKTDLDNYRW